VARTGLLISATYEVLLRAINRWKDLWDNSHARDMPSKRRLAGFTKYCLELWQLAHKILEVAQDRNPESAYMMHKPTDSLKELHSFIQHYL
jgi:hypothetical protein